MTQCYLVTNLPDDTQCACDNCGKVTSMIDLEMITDIEERLDPGGIIPAGECPECGALAYVIEDAKPKLLIDVLRGILDRAEIDIYDGDLALEALSDIRQEARHTIARA